MRLSSKRHGYVDAFYYKNSTVFHRYNLNGRTTAEKLNWMFKHIAERTDLNKGDLKLVADEEGGVHMINRKSGGRMYAQKISKYFFWYEDTLLDMANMHEDYGYNQ